MLKKLFKSLRSPLSLKRQARPRSTPEVLGPRQHSLQRGQRHLLRERAVGDAGDTELLEPRETRLRGLVQQVGTRERVGGRVGRGPGGARQAAASSAVATASSAEEAR